MKLTQLTGQPNCYRNDNGQFAFKKGSDTFVEYKQNKLQHKTVFVNDPSAGSPTETLLRLLLSLDGQVWASSQHIDATTRAASTTGPKTSPNHPIDSSDGRCVQRAGT